MLQADIPQRQCKHRSPIGVTKPDNTLYSSIQRIELYNPLRTVRLIELDISNNMHTVMADSVNIVQGGI